jgi:hypothetical protein
MKLRQKRSYFQNINQQIILLSISTFTVDVLVAGKIEFMKVIFLEIANSTTCIYVSNHEMFCNVIKRDFYERLHFMILIFLFTCNIRNEFVTKETLLFCIQN